MTTMRRLSVFAASVVAGIAFGYGIASQVSVRDFTILYSLDRKRNDQAIVGAIDGAKTYVYFAIYEFTKENIADALIRAKARGLDVRGVMDRGESQKPAQAAVIKKLEGGGIPVELQKHTRAIMPPTMLVTDNSYAIGSYNWTQAATFLYDKILEISSADTLQTIYH